MGKIARPKKEEGLGLLEARHCNVALLGKLVGTLCITSRSFGYRWCLKSMLAGEVFWIATTERDHIHGRLSLRKNRFLNRVSHSEWGKPVFLCGMMFGLEMTFWLKVKDI